MIRLLQWLFLGHVHKWKTLEKRELRQTYGGKVDSVGTRYIQECETCGIVVKRDLI